MKKILTLTAAFLITAAVYAQKADEIKPAELPKNVPGWISHNFKKASIDRAAKISENKNILGYCVAVTADGRKMIFVFDKNGKYLDKIKKMTEAQDILKPAKPVKK